MYEPQATTVGLERVLKTPFKNLPFYCSAAYEYKHITFKKESQTVSESDGSFGRFGIITIPI